MGVSPCQLEKRENGKRLITMPPKNGTTTMGRLQTMINLKFAERTVKKRSKKRPKRFEDAAEDTFLTDKSDSGTRWWRERATQQPKKKKKKRHCITMDKILDAFGA